MRRSGGVWWRDMGGVAFFNGLHSAQSVGVNWTGMGHAMNDQPAQAPPNRKSHRLKTAIFFLVGFFALYLVYRYSLSSAIQGRLDSIRRSGLPATCAELDKWYTEPPAGENASDVYHEAFAHYESWTNKPARLSVASNATDRSKFSSPPRTRRDQLPTVGQAKLPLRTEPLPAETRQLVAEYLSDNAEALQLLHRASAMKSCRYPIDLNKGFATLLPHLNQLRQAARLLSLEAMEQTEEQRPQEAVESVIASLNVSRSLNQEPMLISYLVHVACQGISLESLQRILNRMPLTDTQLSELAAAIEESENQQALTRAFVGERCMGQSGFEELRTGKVPMKDMVSFLGEPPWWCHLFWLYRTTGLLELDERCYLDIMEENVKATRLPPPEDMAAASAVVGKVNHLSLCHVLSRMMLPALDQAVIKAGRCDAMIHNAQVAIAVEHFRLANATLPKQLSDLVPAFLSAVPSDPFDGKPLRYKTLAKGYVVYSVGDDREDNGGVEKNSKGVSWVPGTDITFTVER